MNTQRYPQRWTAGTILSPFGVRRGRRASKMGRRVPLRVILSLTLTLSGLTMVSAEGTQYTHAHDRPGFDAHERGTVWALRVPAP
jgi:hypothetical protein